MIKLGIDYSQTHSQLPKNFWISKSHREIAIMKETMPVALESNADEALSGESL
jgi:hypothetical protein